MEFMNLELAGARQRVNRAELALERAEAMLDEECGTAVNLALCCSIRSARRRVIEARSRLAKIDCASVH